MTFLTPNFQPRVLIDLEAGMGVSNNQWQLLQELLLSRAWREQLQVMNVSSPRAAHPYSLHLSTRLLA